MLSGLILDQNYQDRAMNVVVIGDSRVAEGFSPETANVVSNGRGINFIPLGMPGTTPRIWNYFLRSVNRPSRPLQAVVVMATSFDDSDVLENLDDRVLDINFMMPLLAPRNIPQFVESFHGNAARTRALRAAALPALAMQSDIHAFLCSPLKRIAKVDTYYDHYSKSLYAYPGHPERIPDLPRAILSLPVVDQSMAPPNLVGPLNDYLRDIRRERPASLVEATKTYRKVWYGRIAEYFHSQGIPVFVFQIPRGPFHKELVGDRQTEGALSELAREGDVTLLNTAPFVDLEEPQYFFDFLHLNAAGRQAFSERLATIVTPLIQ